MREGLAIAGLFESGMARFEGAAEAASTTRVIVVGSKEVIDGKDEQSYM